MRITVQYWGPKCPLRLTRNPLRLEKTRTYRMPVVVSRNPRAREGGASEQNPFNFVISTSPPLRESGFTLTSATVTTDFAGQQALWEFWSASLRGSSFTGRLVRSHRAAGAPLMVLNALTTDRLLVPCNPGLGTQPKTFQSLKEGARLTGTFTDRRVDLTLVGQTFDRRNRFTARISASR